jgi:hypothetical protein
MEKTSYIFKNSAGQQVVVQTEQNYPSIALEQIKMTFYEYGSKSFVPNDLGDVFTQCSYKPSCIVNTEPKNAIDESTISYYVEEKNNTNKYREDLIIKVYKKNKKIFEGAMKVFAQKAYRLENTYKPFK